MLRFKNFDATGLSPNGVLFAGDLNLFEDLVAAQTDLAQTISLGTLVIGESGLQLLRYGASEARLTGALRVDGIIRALGGLYAGSFTSTLRDAIPSGFRPYGLVILNSTSNRLEYNANTDASPNWQPLVFVAPPGTLAARPTASINNAGGTYLATDVNGGTLYVSTGSTWSQAGLGVTQTTSPSVINRSGTVGGRPSAVAVGAGTTYAATDDHGGTLQESDGATWFKTAASINGEVLIGSVMDWPWGIGSLPAHMALPYGQAFSRTVYSELSALAAAIGYGVYGAGDGFTTFNGPDHRGRVSVGKDDMGGVAANRITVAISGISGATLGAVFGAEGITLTTAQLPAHNHPDTISFTANPHRHRWLNSPGGGAELSFGLGAGSSHSYSDMMNGPSTGDLPGIEDTTVTLNKSGSVGNTGSGSVHQNTQPSIIVNKVMRVL